MRRLAASIKPRSISQSYGSKEMLKAFALTQLQVRQLQRIWATVRARSATQAADAIFCSLFARVPEARFVVSEIGELSEWCQRHEF